MKTTLKRGMGRGASVNGSGRAIFPPVPPTPMTRYRQPEPPRRGAWQVVRAVLLWTVLAAIVLAGGAAGAAYLKTHQFLEAISPKTRADRAAAKRLDAAIPGQPTVALVIGTDRRKGTEAELTGRSDTLILVRADPEMNSLSMLSFPRDLTVTVKCPGHPDYTDRINGAFSACGALGSVETVRALTGLPINYFVTVNFRGFTQLVNQLGGVWVDVDTLFSIMDAVERNVVVGRGGNKALDPQTLKDYVYFAHGLPAGHVFQSKIEGLTGQNELSAPTGNIAAAVRDFVQPDVNSPAKARDVTLRIKRRSRAPRPRDITTTVLHGNGIDGSAANAAYELGQRGYKIVVPRTGTPAN